MKKILNNIFSKAFPLTFPPFILKIESSSGTAEGPENWMMFDQAATGKMRTGPNPTVADFSLMISDRSIFKRYMRRENEKYFYLIVLMGVTYTLPVIQLVYKHQQDSIALGERVTERDGAN